MLEKALQEALKAYRELGGTDKVAKGTELTEMLVLRLQERFIEWDLPYTKPFNKKH